jgi:hypothetical protein
MSDLPAPVPFLDATSVLDDVRGPGPGPRC